MDEAQTVTINGVIDEGIYGNRYLAKSGRGTLVLTAANTYSGVTYVLDDGGTPGPAGRRHGAQFPHHRGAGRRHPDAGQQRRQT